MAVIDKVKAAVNSLTKGKHQLAESTNIDSQIQAKDLLHPPDDTSEEYGADPELIKLGDERYEEARLGRYRHNKEIFEGLAFFAGNHYSEWSEELGEMAPVGGKSKTLEERFYRKTINMIPVMVERFVARIMAQYPDAWATPMRAGNADDMRKAEIDTKIIGHTVSKTNFRALLRETVRSMAIASTTFIEVGWDNKATVKIGIPNPQTGDVDYHEAEAGDVWHGLLDSTSAYPDPNAALTHEGIHGGAYFIKRHSLPVDTITRKWGVLVDATTDMDTYQWIERRIEHIASDFGRSSAQEKNAAVVTEVWEKPSEQYKSGRFWVYCGKTMLHKGPWPYTKRNKYPFLPIGYRKNKGSIWDINMVHDLKSLQIELNRTATMRAGRMEWDQPVLLVPDNAEVSPDDFLDPHYGKQIGYKGEAVGGAKPMWHQPPASPDYDARIASIIANMEMVAGVRDFNSDAAPTINSGREYEIRTNEDKSRIAPIAETVAELVKDVYEWDLALYQQFGTSFPRFLEMDAKDVDGKADSATAYADLRLLKEGHSSVVLQPGSGIGKLPAIQDEELDALMKTAVTLPSPLLDLYLQLNQSIRFDENVQRAIDGMKVIEAQKAASQPNPQAIAQQQAQAAQALQTQKLQFEAEQNQLDLQAKGEIAAIEVHAEQQKQNARAQADQSTEIVRQNAPVVPSVTIAVKAGSQGTIGAEKLAGLPDLDNATEVAKMLTPPKPAAPSTPKAKP